MLSEPPRDWLPASSFVQSSHPPLTHESQQLNSPDSTSFNMPSTSQLRPSSTYNIDPYIDSPEHLSSSYPPEPTTPSIDNQNNPPFAQQPPHPAQLLTTPSGPPLPPHTSARRDGRQSPKQESFYAPNAAELYSHAQLIATGSDNAGTGGTHYPSNSVPRLPPILQVEKQQVTTTATQAASASRRRNEAHFICPVPGCGSTFTRRFNLRGHLRSHTEERPYICEWPGCKKGFARQHDCKRHQSLHSTKAQSNLCPGCKKPFSRLDALNRHLRSEGGADCKQFIEERGAPTRSKSSGEDE